MNGQRFITRRVPDTIDVERGVNDQCSIEGVTPNIASIRIFNGITGERKEPFRWVCHVGGHIVRVIAGNSHLVKVLEIRLASGSQISSRGRDVVRADLT